MTSKQARIEELRCLIESDKHQLRNPKLLSHPIPMMKVIKSNLLIRQNELDELTQEDL